jgi:hypothetical protein
MIDGKWRMKLLDDKCTFSCEILTCMNLQLRSLFMRPEGERKAVPLQSCRMLSLARPTNVQQEGRVNSQKLLQLFMSGPPSSARLFACVCASWGT